MPSVKDGTTTSGQNSTDRCDKILEDRRFFSSSNGIPAAAHLNCLSFIQRQECSRLAPCNFVIQLDIDDGVNSDDVLFDIDDFSNEIAIDTLIPSDARSVDEKGCKVDRGDELDQRSSTEEHTAGCENEAGSLSRDKAIQAHDVVVPAELDHEKKPETAIHPWKETRAQLKSKDSSSLWQEYQEAIASYRESPLDVSLIEKAMNIIKKVDGNSSCLNDSFACTHLFAVVDRLLESGELRILAGHVLPLMCLLLSLQPKTIAFDLISSMVRVLEFCLLSSEKLFLAEKVSSSIVFCLDKLINFLVVEDNYCPDLARPICSVALGFAMLKSTLCKSFSSIAMLKKISIRSITLIGLLFSKYQLIRSSMVDEILDHLQSSAYPELDIRIADSYRTKLSSITYLLCMILPTAFSGSISSYPSPWVETLIDTIVETGLQPKSSFALGSGSLNILVKELTDKSRSQLAPLLIGEDILLSSIGSKLLLLLQVTTESHWKMKRIIEYLVLIAEYLHSYYWIEKYSHNSESRLVSSSEIRKSLEKLSSNLSLLSTIPLHISSNFFEGEESDNSKGVDISSGYYVFEQYRRQSRRGGVVLKLQMQIFKGLQDIFQQLSDTHKSTAIIKSLLLAFSKLSKPPVNHNFCNDAKFIDRVNSLALQEGGNALLAYTLLSNPTSDGKSAIDLLSMKVSSGGRLRRNALQEIINQFSSYDVESKCKVFNLILRLRASEGFFKMECDTERIMWESLLEFPVGNDALTVDRRNKNSNSVSYILRSAESHDIRQSLTTLTKEASFRLLLTRYANNRFQLCLESKGEEEFLSGLSTVKTLIESAPHCSTQLDCGLLMRVFMRATNSSSKVKYSPLATELVSKIMAVVLEHCTLLGENLSVIAKRLRFILFKSPSTPTLALSEVVSCIVLSDEGFQQYLGILKQICVESEDDAKVSYCAVLCGYFIRSGIRYQRLHYETGAEITKLLVSRWSHSPNTESIFVALCCIWEVDPEFFGDMHAPKIMGEVLSGSNDKLNLIAIQSFTRFFSTIQACEDRKADSGCDIRVLNLAQTYVRSRINQICLLTRSREESLSIAASRLLWTLSRTQEFVNFEMLNVAVKMAYSPSDQTHEIGQKMVSTYLDGNWKLTDLGLEYGLWEGIEFLHECCATDLKKVFERNNLFMHLYKKCASSGSRVSTGRKTLFSLPFAKFPFKGEESQPKTRVLYLLLLCNELMRVAFESSEEEAYLAAQLKNAAKGLTAVMVQSEVGGVNLLLSKLGLEILDITISWLNNSEQSSKGLLERQMKEYIEICKSSS